MFKILRNRQGFSLVFPLFFLILITCCGFVLDIGRAHMVKAQLQTIVDSSALAGTSVAEVESDIELVEDNGSLMLKESNHRVKINDIEAAHEKAKMLALVNSAGSDYWEFENQKTTASLSEEETGWSGQVKGDDKYSTQARARLNTGFLKFLGFDEITVYAEGDAEAFMVKQKGEE